MDLENCGKRPGTALVPESFTVDPLQVKAEPNNQVETYPKNTRRHQLERGGGRVRKVRNKRGNTKLQGVGGGRGRSAP